MTFSFKFIQTSIKFKPINISDNKTNNLTVLSYHIISFMSKYSKYDSGLTVNIPNHKIYIYRYNYHEMIYLQSRCGSSDD